MVNVSGQSIGYVTAITSFCVSLVVMCLVLYRIHQATNKLLVAATLSKSATNHWLILSQASRATSATNSSTATAESPPPAHHTLSTSAPLPPGSAINSATSSPLQGLPPSISSTNVSFLSCSQEQLIEHIVSNKFIEIARAEKKSRSVELDNNNDFGANSSLVTRCKEEHRFLKSIVEKVFSVSQLKCRRKKKLVRLWHKPTPEPLHAADISVVASRLENVVATFDRRHQFYDNKEYADLLWKKLESSLHPASSTSSSNSLFLFHVTVFDMESREEDYGVRTDHPWLWEVFTKHSDGRPRTVLVVAVPHGEKADLDQLDCLQQAALSPVQEGVSAGCLPGHCRPRPGAKADKVYSGCRGPSTAGSGTIVICWGCNVWHRWSKHFPVLHIQGPQMWNNVVWTAR